MEAALISLLQGIPIAAAVLYVWIVSEKNHKTEIEEWRKMLNKKDDELNAFGELIVKLSSAIEKLTFIVENYVITGRKNSTGKQD